jgi:hypothetical protein
MKELLDAFPGRFQARRFLMLDEVVSPALIRSYKRFIVAA